MCGIVGIIDRNATDASIKMQINEMLDAVYQRGPDGDGRYFCPGLGLGMRRLSIIDIDNGDQPFFNENKSVVVFQNGEIYNYKELTVELESAGYKFISRCDTEVLAHGYTAWGAKKLFQKLDGMFAIAILDESQNRIYLGRDRFGEKPLYYASNEQTFAFSSDLRTLAKLDWVNTNLSIEALFRYLQLGFFPGPQSIYQGIVRLPPAHYLSLDLRSLNYQLLCFYLPNLMSSDSLVPDVAIETERLLRHSVDLRLRADVPVGIFLSGGIDSSLIAALAARKNSLISTFSIGFNSVAHDESRYARIVSDHIGSNHYHFNFSENSFVDLLPKVIENLDEPLGDQACLPTFWLAEEARKKVKVVLSGEGADEIFGGYLYYQQFAADRASSRKLINYKESMSCSGFPLLISPAASCDLLVGAIAKSPLQLEYENNLLDWLDTSRSSFQKAMVCDLTSWLPDNLLVKLDRMTMAHSLEARAPFLSADVVDFVYGLKNENWANHGNESKPLLRTIGRKYLPSIIFNRKKQGFVLPMDVWITRWFKRETPKDFFSNRVISEINTEKVIQYVESQLCQRKFNQRFIFALIVLYEWCSIQKVKIS